MSMKKTLIGLGLVAASGAALALPNIAVLATGGTIASKATADGLTPPARSPVPAPPPRALPIRPAR